MHRQERVEKVRQSDSMGLGHQPVQSAIAVKAPGTALLDDFKSRLVFPVEKLLADPTIGGTVDQGQGIGSVPLNLDHGRMAIGEEAADDGVGAEIFELQGEVARGLVSSV